MEAGEAASEVLLQLPWLPMNISGCQLLTKSWFGETTYHLLLTDTHCVWEERAGSLDIQKRAQELNRRLRAPVEAFFTHLCQVARPCLSGSDSQSDGGAQISLIRQDDGDLRVKLKSELAGLPFYWEFHCSLSPVTVACAQLVRPLLAMNHLLQRQVMDLEDLLVRKDAEIQDYKENGASLSRERLQTSVFEEQTFRNDFMAKLPGRRAEPQTGRAKCGVPQRHHQPVIDMRAERSGRQLRLFDGTVTQDSLMIGGQVIITCIQGCPEEDPFLFLTSHRLLIPEDLTWSPAHPGASSFWRIFPENDSARRNKRKVIDLLQSPCYSPSLAFLSGQQHIAVASSPGSYPAAISTLPLLSSDQQLVLNFHADLQNLYAAVVQHSNARRRKRKLSEEERPAAEDADVSPQAVAEGVTTTGTGEDKQQRQSAQADAEESKMADRAPTKQVPLLPSDPAERASSKPKKKKVGLFR
ncbi:Non--like proteinous end-joining factor 1 [Takifugu flavidus]|uniref:Non-homologous end-joining factor 1 n=1 Tax=Takifugu flavidus TaxID=433684 RepID=A0A5C6N9W4_9TELE|nr:Non--like proteinous end-joining factor 1 [Takifugu flavidus]